MLGDYSIPTPKFVSFGLDELPEINFFPVVLKIESEKIVHKSDFGAVKLNINSAAALEAAKKEILTNIRSRGVEPDETDRFIAVQMLSGQEVYVGMVDDEIFGKTVVFGKGGVFLEMYKDVCFIDVYAGDEEIKRAIGLTKISKIFSGFRGFNYDLNQAVEFIKSVQKFILANPDIVELDFNPVLATSDGLKIVDARIKRGEQRVEKLGTLRKDRPNFFKNERVALIGASSDTSKVGYAIAKNSLTYGGDMFFVNSKGGELFGKKLYKGISEIDGDIDTAVIHPFKICFRYDKRANIQKNKKCHHNLCRI